MEAMIDDSNETRPCLSCGHPAGHHDGGECWTDRHGNEVWDNAECGCLGFEDGSR